MSDLTKLLVSVMLAAGQAVYSFQSNTAALAQAPSQAGDSKQQTSIELTTDSAQALVAMTPAKPDFDQEVMLPLRKAQADAAAKAKADAEAAAAAARARALAAANAASAPAQPTAAPAPVGGSHTDWMAAAGISPSDFGYVSYIMDHESGWRPWAVSPNGYVGLGQTSRANLSAACPNWQSDPVCQLRFFAGYASRYNGWQGSYDFWITHHWW